MSKKSNHADVKRFVGVRALVTTLMLVVDYVIPDGRNDASVFEVWCDYICTKWPIALREQVMRWAGQRRLIASDHAVANPLPKPACVDSLPFVKKHNEFTRDALLSAVATLKVNNVPPAPDGHYHFELSNGLSTTIRECLENEVLDAISGLPDYARSVLRGAWSILEGHGPEFDDARIQLVGMAFDLANGTGIDARDLSQYAYHVLDMRLAPMPPKASVAPDSLTQVQKLIADECGGLCALLLEKNRKYGNSALNPVRIFSKASPEEQIAVRIDDKLSRIAHGNGQLADEDTELDLLGYLVLRRVSRVMRKVGG